MADKNYLKIAEVFQDIADGLETGSFGKRPTIAVTGHGSEHGEENVMAGAVAAAAKGIDVVYLGTLPAPEGSGVKSISTTSADKDLEVMEELLTSGQADAAVAMHYSFPIGVSTIGLVDTPARGRKMFLASTTGTSSSDRVSGMVLNAIAGVAVAKAEGKSDPSVGILNLDGARQVERILKQLTDKGYKLTLAESARADGGCVLRGNDVLLGTPDVMVTDSLTGNVLMKLLSAGSSGGVYETSGHGYGPGVGDGYEQIVLIVSRASGAPLIARAIEYAADMVRGDLPGRVAEEFAAAKKAGLEQILSEQRAKSAPQAKPEDDFVKPEKEIVTGEIAGVDVMDLDAAVTALMRTGYYAESGMGCTGPIIRVAEDKLEAAYKVLLEADFVSE